MTRRRFEARSDVRPATGPLAVTPARPVASVHPLLQLQRTRGNQHVQRLVGQHRGAVEVGAPDSVHEQEADRAADLIMRKVSASGAAAGGDGTEAGPGPSRTALGAAGGGRGLPADVRTRFEGAFGADLSGVRVHTGHRADALNRGLGSVAFTHGADVYFGHGRYAPDTRAGQHLLAHELTHVVQQSGTAGLVQRRLSLQRTKWEAAQDMRASEEGEGGTGVVFVHDAPLTNLAADRPLVVKSGDNPIESIVSARVHNWMNMQGGPSRGGWSAVAPDVRHVDTHAERTTIREALSRIIRPGDETARTVVNRIGPTDDVAVYEFAAGQKFASLTEPSQGAPSKATRPTARSKLNRGAEVRELRDNSGFRLLQDDGFVTTMGRQTAVDILTGNFDRMAGSYNPANFFVNRSGRSVSLIDNNLGSAGSDLLQARRRRPGRPELTADESYGRWTGNESVRLLRQADYAGIANKVFTTMWGVVGDGMRAEDTTVVKQTLDAAQPIFARGVQEGRETIIASLPRASAVLTWDAGLGSDEVTRQLRRRIAFIAGG